MRIPEDFQQSPEEWAPGQARGYEAGLIQSPFYTRGNRGPQRQKVTCPRPLGELEVVELKSVFPPICAIRNWVRTATGQKGHGTDLGLDIHFLSHRAL